MNATAITIETLVHAPLDRAWHVWTEPACIVRWNHASDDWTCPRAENDLRAGGTFSWRMEARDGSVGFDYAGIYDEVVPMERITAALGDGRKVEVTFRAEGAATRVTETFETEDQNSAELQRAGWGAILENYRKVAEGA